jgi:signal transduction histidine kinase
VKELTILHQTARLLQNEARPAAELMEEIVALLPAAWQYPEVTAAAIRFRDISVMTRNYQECSWMQRASFKTRGGDVGEIVIAYTEEKPVEVEGPFLAEERDLIESLAEMLRAYFQHKLADEELHAARADLERQVEARTEDLRRLAAELSLAEARERREIAVDLHDHIIQQFAFIKLRTQQFHGDAVFCGFERNLEEIVGLVDAAIRHTRQLTFEISSPILYELGLPAALEWLGEQFEKQHRMKVRVKTNGHLPELSEAVRVTLFKCVQELLTNAAKYSQAKAIGVKLGLKEGNLEIEVADNGVGFDSKGLKSPSDGKGGFGLFSIRERLCYFGGGMEITSAPGKGTTVKLEMPLNSQDSGLWRNDDGRSTTIVSL